MKRSILICCLVVLFAIAFNTNTSTAAPVKRILLEAFTGTWCPWCPTSTYYMEKLEAKYPDQIIGAKWHVFVGYNDPMILSEVSTLTSGFGISSAPSGMLDRRVFNSAFPLDPSVWEQALGYLINDAPEVEVNCYYSISGSVITATVQAKFLTSVTGDLRFNLYVLEDGIVYSQKNNYSGYAGYEFLPYYSQPNPITNFVHNNTVRAACGGPMGKEGIIPSSVSSGDTYSTQFTYTIPSGQVKENIWLVGLVQDYGTTYKILNCAKGTAGVQVMEVTSTETATAKAKPTGEAFEKTFTIKNTNSSKLTFTLTTETSDRTPSDWTADLVIPTTQKQTVAANELTLDPGATANVTLKLTPTTSKGVGDVTLTIKAKSMSTARPSEQTMTVVSKELTALEIIDDDESGAHSIGSSLAGNLSNLDFFSLPSADFMKVNSDLSDLKAIVWTCGETGTITADEASYIKSWVDAGHPVLMSGTVFANSCSKVSPNLLTTIGVTCPGKCWQGYSTSKINLVGKKDDPISGSFLTNTYLNLTSNSNLPYYFKITNTKATTIFTYKGTDTIAAVKSENAKARTILMGFNPSKFSTSSQKNSIITNSLKWLYGGGATIAFDSATFDFGEVPINAPLEKSFNIKNTGNEDLIVKTAEVDEDYAQYFSVVGFSQQTIAPNGTYPLKLKFSPKAKINYNANITLTTNDMTKPTVEMTMEGTGGEPVGVEDQAFIMDFSASPNPTVENMRIKFNVTGNAPSFVDMYVVDVKGSKVASIVNSTIAPGEQIIDFNVANLSNGSYYIVYTLNGITEQYSFVVNK